MEDFNSTTYGKQGLDGVVECLWKFIKQDPQAEYQLVVGTDSELITDKKADFVIAIVIHRLHLGGVYFWHRIEKDKIFSLRQRMYEEAFMSMDIAGKLMTEIAKQKKEGKNGIEPLDGKENNNGLHLEIHVDIGTKGETREMINEIVGMVRGSGYSVKTKPEAYGASNVADRHT